MHSERSQRPAFVHVKHVNPFQNVMSGQWPTVAIGWTLQVQLQTITNSTRRKQRATPNSSRAATARYKRQGFSEARLRTQLKHIQHTPNAMHPPPAPNMVCAHNRNGVPQLSAKVKQSLTQILSLSGLLASGPKLRRPYFSNFLATPPPINWFNQPLVEPIPGVCVWETLPQTHSLQLAPQRFVLTSRDGLVRIPVRVKHVPVRTCRHTICSFAHWFLKRLIRPSGHEFVVQQISNMTMSRDLLFDKPTPHFFVDKQICMCGTHQDLLNDICLANSLA